MLYFFSARILLAHLFHGYFDVEVHSLLQDISADEAQQLHSLLTMLLKRSPEIFKDDESSQTSKVRDN